MCQVSSGAFQNVEGGNLTGLPRAVHRDLLDFSGCDIYIYIYTIQWLPKISQKFYLAMAQWGCCACGPLRPRGPCRQAGRFACNNLRE
jgi:hypothetical protein